MQWPGRNKPDPAPIPSVDGQDPRRSAPRHATETLSCHLGDVVDISSTGVRVRCKSKPPFREGSMTTIKFTFNGGKLQVGVQERWRKRVGWRGGYEIGLMYVNNSPNVIKAIESLVKFGFLCPDAVAGEQPKAKPKTKPKLRVSIDLPDYYAVLNIAPDADGQKVHAAYRQLARKYHPDTNKAPDAQDHFIRVCEAYKVLSDPEQRKSYDLRQAG
ncbi:MAG: DnaJ domain-containing protein [Phycisphaerales bacterium]